MGFHLEFLLLHDDPGIAAEIGKMASGRHGQLGHRSIEVIRQRTHHGGVARHEVLNGGMICDVERDRPQLGVIARGQEASHPFRLDVRQGDLSDFRVLQQIECAGRALQPRAEYEHFHRGKIAGPADPSLRSG
jgi:hypothetical protein